MIRMIIQIVLILIMLLKIILEIKYHYLKKKLHNIKVSLEMKKNLDGVLYKDTNLKIIKGSRYVYDIADKQMIIKNKSIDTLDEYCMVLHEYGHYKDIYYKTKDFNSFLVLIKKLIPIVFVIIVCIICAKYVFGIKSRVLFFLVILEIMLVFIDFLITIRLEYIADKNVLFILEQQENKYFDICKWYCYNAMINQVIDRFFLVLGACLLLMVC